jgi:CRP-like cAMP-binding protein
MNDSIVLSGNLSFLPLGDVLQLLGSSGSTGVLRLTNRYSPNPGYVYFNAGQPVNAQNGDVDGLDALYSLFGWVDGAFEFFRQTSVTEKRITKSRMGIILEGMKLLDDGHTKTVGPETANKKRGERTLVSALPSVIKGPFVDYMYVVDEEDFFDGEPIVEEGKHGNWVWVILEGVVDIVKEDENENIPIIRLGDGSFIGSMASFLLQGHIRTASAIAVGNVQLGVLDSQRLAQEYAGLSYGFREFLTSLDRRLKNLTTRVVERRNGTVEMQSINGGEKVIARQGDEKLDKLFLIKQGHANIVRETDNGPVLLCSLGKGDYFGHLPFLDIGQEPEFASVYGTEGIELVQMDGAKLQSEYNRLSTTFKNIVDNMATCMIVTADHADHQRMPKGRLPECPAVL